MINGFFGEYRFLSNFWYAEIYVQELDMRFPTNEHLYQALKSSNVNIIREFTKLKTPSQAKIKGSKVQLRDDWESVKLEAMELCIRLKFDQHDMLRGKLRGTADEELVEANNWGDRFWGISNGQGQNHLGKLLMAYRDAQNSK